VERAAHCANFQIGEDALANLSIERTESGTITGHVRIRSKTQGIALSLGDRITSAFALLSPYMSCAYWAFSFFL
jgi:Coatomer beta subunit appendage platform